MLNFPNCKINLGLYVVSKRPDGFHNIETVFYPISWCDALEVIENTETEEAFVFTQSGLAISGSTEQNLIYKTWDLIRKIKPLPPIRVHLHKNIPMGAGLGGGSADAAFFINLIDNKFDLKLSDEEKYKVAKQIGSDCSVFIKNVPVFASGKGDEFSELSIDLSKYHILLVYPNIHSNTKDAYESLIPKSPDNDLKELLKNTDVSDWKDKLKNDFEGPIFRKYPVIAELKDKLYAVGALYASMSGSGSSVFGIFKEEPVIKLPETFSYYLQKPERKIL